MKSTFKTLTLALLAVSAMATSPALADMGGTSKSDESHQAIHQSMHGNASSSMMEGSMMGNHHGMMASMMPGNHHAMSAMIHGAQGTRNVDCPYVAQTDRDLSADDARDILEAHLVWRGNKRLKIGKVEASGDEAFTAEILTIDNSLVELITINKNTGAMSRK